MVTLCSTFGETYMLFPKGAALFHIPARGNMRVFLCLHIFTNHRYLLDLGHCSLYEVPARSHMHFCQ